MRTFISLLNVTLFLGASLTLIQGQNYKIVLEKIDTVDNTTKLGIVVRQNDGSLAVSRYKIGDFVQGGVVFYVDETGQHGLVCNRTDQSIDIRWYAGTIGNTQAKGDGVYSGEMNTAIIIGAQAGFGDDGAEYAARLCSELLDFAYGDWYLRSKEELNIMYLNRSIIEASITISGGNLFDDDYYWSSTESATCCAYFQSFTDGL